MRWLQRVIDEIQRVNGVMQGTMRRDEALAFFRMGQQLERAEITCRVLAVRADSAVPDTGREVYNEVHQMALLRSLASYQPFRRAMPARPDATSTLRFLLQDEAFPRAVSACLSELRDLVKALPHNEPILAACTDTAVLVADAPVVRPTPASLRAFLAELGPAIGNLHDHIEASFFSPVVPTTVAPDERVHVDRSTRAPAPPDAVPRCTSGGGQDRRRGTGQALPRHAHHHLRVRGPGGAVLQRGAPTAPPDRQPGVSRVQPRDRPRTEHSIRVRRPLRQQRGDVRGPRRIRPHGGDLHQRGAGVTTSCSSRRPAVGVGPDAARDRPAIVGPRRPSLSCPVAPHPHLNALAEYAQGSFHPGRPVVEAVLDLTDRIYREFDYEPGFTSIATPLLEVLEERRGVCQDFAHLMIGCIRSLGLAARYVSGYIETFPPPGQERLVGADASHAWASVYLPGWGWVDVDPTNDQFVAESYVTTAWGRDYWDVSPLRGSVEGGGGFAPTRCGRRCDAVSSRRRRTL